MIAYAVEPDVTTAEFVDVLRRSGLAERRPVDEPARIAGMVAHGNLMIAARDGGRLVGVARSLTDFAFCCYLSDLAVDRAYQGQGIGRTLIERTRAAAGPDATLILLAAPGMDGYYGHIGLEKFDNCWGLRRGARSRKG